MRIIFLTNEYPPYIYGGAGVHAEYLLRELNVLNGGRHILDVFCFGDQKEHSGNKNVEGISLDFDFPCQDERHRKLLDTLFRNIIITGSVAKADILHCHTWYTYLAGCLIKRIYNIPLIITAHSLEPQRPWKEEQLGTAYNISTWLEKTAYESADGVIAVSKFMKKSVHDFYKVPFKKIRVIPNAIDANYYKPTFNPSILTLYQIKQDNPFILFVGRITRQKGIIHFVNAIKYLLPGIQVVLCASTPDTKEIQRDMEKSIKEACTKTLNKIIWIDEVVPKNHLITLYSHASIFVCPSIYEPFGLINLEAMACGTPVVSSAVGGITEVVDHGKTGLLITFEQKDDHDFEPKDPEKFSRDIAEAINNLLCSPDKIRSMGNKAREKVEKIFNWEVIARQTLEFYKELIVKRKDFTDMHSSTIS